SCSSRLRQDGGEGRDERSSGGKLALRLRQWVSAEYQLAHAAWKSRRACCCTITLPFASHGNAARASVSCLHCATSPGAGGPLGSHHNRCSTARFHTNRAWAQCSRRAFS